MHVETETAKMDKFVIRKSKNVEESVDSLPESLELYTATKHNSKTPCDPV